MTAPDDWEKKVGSSAWRAVKSGPPYVSLYIALYLTAIFVILASSYAVGYYARTASIHDGMTITASLSLVFLAMQAMIIRRLKDNESPF